MHTSGHLIQLLLGAEVEPWSYGNTPEHGPNHTGMFIVEDQLYLKTNKNMYSWRPQREPAQSIVASKNPFHSEQIVYKITKLKVVPYELMRCIISDKTNIQQSTIENRKVEIRAAIQALDNILETLCEQ